MTHRRALTQIEEGLRLVLGVPFAPFGIFTVKPNHKAVVSYFGKICDVKDEGLRYNLPFFWSGAEYFCGTVSKTLPSLDIVDKAGNPIIVASMYNYRVSDPEAFHYTVKGDDDIIKNTAESTLRYACSSHTYDELRNSDEDARQAIVENLINTLQDKMDTYGITIEDFRITDLSYAPIIAQQMLMRQQAQAYSEARADIAKASVDITQDVVSELEMSDKEKERLTSNLVLSIVSQSGVTPTLKL